MSLAGCHCEGRRTQEIDRRVPTPPPHLPVLVVPARQYSEALLSSPLVLSLTVPHSPSQSLTPPDTCRLPDCPDMLAGVG